MKLLGSFPLHARHLGTTEKIAFLELDKGHNPGKISYDALLPTGFFVVFIWTPCLGRNYSSVWPLGN